MLSAVSAALEGLHSSPDPVTQRAGDETLRRLLRDCDVPTLLALLSAPRPEARAFAAQALILRIHDPLPHETPLPWTVATDLLRAVGAAVTGQPSASLCDKLCHVLAYLLLQEVAHTDPFPEGPLCTILAQWCAQSANRPLAMLMVASCAPDEFQRIHSRTGSELATARLHRMLQRGVNNVIREAVEYIQAFMRDSSQMRLPMGTATWTIHVAVDALRSWVSFAEALTWSAVTELRLPEALLSGALGGLQPAACLDVVCDIFTLPGQKDNESISSVVGTVLEAAAAALNRSPDPELLCPMANLIGVCADADRKSVV